MVITTSFVITSGGGFIRHSHSPPPWGTHGRTRRRLDVHGHAPGAARAAGAAEALLQEVAEVWLRFHQGMGMLGWVGPGGPGRPGRPGTWERNG